MNLKTNILILLLVISGTLIAGPTGRDMGRNMGLDLTETQKQQMVEVKERTEARKQAALDDIQAQAKSEMAEFLTADQLAKVEERMALQQEAAELRKEHKQLKRKMRRSNRE